MKFRSWLPAVTLALTLMCIGRAEKTYADHIIGSDFSYKCSNTNDSIFDVTYNFYRDCNGCYVLGQSPKCGTSENCASSSTAPTNLKVTCLTGTSFSGSLNLSRTSIVDITTTCKSVRSRCQQPCNGSFPYGIEKHTFEGQLDLRQAIKRGCCKIEISALLYVRNVGITTGQSQQSFYTSCEINVCDAVCNTSPTLTNDPVAILCCNQPYVFNNGAVDFADNDSISYSFAPAYANQSTQCSYSGSRSPQNPISTYYPGSLKFPYTNPNANPPIGTFLDPQTGDIIFTPTKCGEIAVVVVEMVEWRKDSTGKYKRIGATRRDMQFIVMSCPDNNPPTITNKTYTHRTCETQQICFNIGTDDKVRKPPPPQKPPPPDTVELTWNFGIPGATFKIQDTTARLKTGQFCWTPPLGTASTLPYSFTATVTDDACPLAASATRAFQIYVDPIAEATRNIDTFDCGKYSFESTPFANFKFPAKYTWQLLDSNGDIIFDRGIGSFYSTNSYLSVQQSDTIRFRKGGKYIIQHTVTNKPQCTNTYYDTLVVPPLLEVDLAFGPDTFVCANTKLQLAPEIRNASPPVSFSWDNGDTTASREIALPSSTVDSSFYVEIKDKTGCTAWDSTTVYLRPNPWVHIGPDRRICTYDSIDLVSNDSLAYWDDPRDTLGPVQQGDTLYYEWLLNGNTLSNDTFLSGLNQPGLYLMKVTDSLGCYSTDTMELFVNDLVSANAGGDQTVCWNDLVRLIATELDTAGNAKTGGFQWWDFNDPTNKVDLGTKDTLSFNIQSTTSFQLELFVTEDTTTCYDADTVLVTVNPLPDVKMPNDMEVCHDAGIINLRLGEDPNASGGKWFCPEKPSLVKQDYLFQTDSAGDYGGATMRWEIYYQYIHPSTGCVKTDSFQIKVNPIPEVKLRDGYFCQDKEVVSLEDDKIIALPGGATLSLGRQAWRCLDCGIYNPNDIIEDKGSGGAGAPQDYVLNIDEKSMPLGTKDSDTIEIEFEFRSILGCYNWDTAKIAVTKVPKIDFVGFDDLCWDHGEEDLKVMSQVTPYDGIWKAVDSTGFAPAANLNKALTGDTLNGDTLNTLATPQPAEGSSFTYLMRYFHDRSGCPTSRDTTLTIRGLPVPLIDRSDLTVNTLNEPYQFCELNADVPLTTTNYPGGTWSSDEPTAMASSTFRPSAIDNYNNPFYIYYDYTDIYKCEGRDSVLVEIHAEQTIDISNDTAICRTGSNMTLDVEASYTNSTGFTWIPLTGGSIGNATAEQTTFSFGSSKDTVTTHLLYALTNEGGGSVCPFAEKTMTVLIHPKPIASIDGDTLAGCNPVTVNFTTTIDNQVDPATAKYEWKYPDGSTDNLQNPTSTFNVDGDNPVELKLTSAFGCDTTLSLNVEVHPIPVALFTPNPNNSTTAALPKFQFNNESTVDPVLNSRIKDNIWDFGILSQLDDTSTLQSPLFFYPSDTGTYDVTLTVRTEFGCEDQFTYPVIIGPDILVFIPNVFTPDGAGPTPNNGFRAVVNDAAKEYHLIIFNRWGEVIWETFDKNEEWDGLYGTKNFDNRELVPSDVYAYYLKITSWNDKHFEYTGTVTLIR